ncbi:MAG TPA: SOS response-associated peptidase family protein [Ignavibacteria bacterium]|mgnify:CR=1 FL=1|nr:SOS response-associated peptidase family protein [Ignavibacteria bacterium]
MCRQFITAGKLSNLRKLLKSVYNEDIKIKLLDEIDKDEENIEEEIEREIEEIRRKEEDDSFQDAILTHRIPLIAYNGGELILTEMKWGIQFDPEKKTPLIFNSRDDTISTKPFWKKLFDRNRILIPMTGFYEWKDVGKKKKLKIKINLKNRKIFFVPGLYWRNKNGINEFSLVTTSPSKFLQEIHNRMPVILDDKIVMNYFTDSLEENLEKLKPSGEEIKFEEMNN